MKKIILILIVNCTLSIVICKGQWIQTNGPIGPVACEVLCLAVKGDTIFAGTFGGLYFSPNSGASWIALINGLPASEIYTIVISKKNIFAGTSFHGVYLSTNNGASWAAVNKGLTNPYIHALAINGTNIFAGTLGGGVFLSTDNGTNWKPVNKGLTDTIVASLAIRGEYIFAGASEGIFLSTNNGTSWNSVGLPSYNIYPIAINGNNIFAGVNDIGGVFLSSDNGTSWTAIDNGLPYASDSVVQSFVISGTNIFAGTGVGGIFLSTNNGGYWANVGILNYQIPTLAIFKDTLFAGTINGGVWKRALSEMNGINEPVVQSLMFKVQCYPNPVNQSSIISYKLSEKGNVNISIYDLTGREVVTLIDKTQGKGEYKINFNAENLNSGVYFLKAAIKNEVRMVKFVKE